MSQSQQPTPTDNPRKSKLQSQIAQLESNIARTQTELTTALRKIAELDSFKAKQWVRDSHEDPVTGEKYGTESNKEHKSPEANGTDEVECNGGATQDTAANTASEDHTPLTDELNRKDCDDAQPSPNKQVTTTNHTPKTPSTRLIGRDKAEKGSSSYDSTNSSTLQQLHPGSNHLTHPSPGGTEVSEKQLLNHADSILSSHVKLLKRYNETKDAAMTMLGLLAEWEGKSMSEFLVERGITEDD